jgi:hypothetical protein
MKKLFGIPLSASAAAVAIALLASPVAADPSHDVRHSVSHDSGRYDSYGRNDRYDRHDRDDRRHAERDRRTVLQHRTVVVQQNPVIVHRHPAPPRHTTVIVQRQAEPSLDRLIAQLINVALDNAGHDRGYVVATMVNGGHVHRR